jgi:hypothetical protein
LIGYADVKSAPVHFYVKRESDLDTENTPIPFDVAVVNEGNAMDLTTGIFTAPWPGIYSAGRDFGRESRLCLCPGLVFLLPALGGINCACGKLLIS